MVCKKHHQEFHMEYLGSVDCKYSTCIPKHAQEGSEGGGKKSIP